ncbi:MAG: PEP-CTERM sorting domain-containing protein [Proteobacteria bacterium]|nr:MAG: PEP-CTERM sorting domain-containing protein [Pseudomonadota bacterium]
MPPRDTDRYDITLKGYSGGQAPQLSLYSAHLKAQDSGQDDDNRRLAETTAIRNDAQTLGHAFIVGGDFNVQSSNDIGYAKLIGSQTDNGGRFFDPMNRSTNVTWENRAEYSYLHTQDPTGSGGMDSRFDFLLTNGSLVDGKGFDYVGNAAKAYTPDAGSTWNDSAHSYTVWGNDGTSFNATLKTTGNTEVGEGIAQALKNAATTAGGHLPVFLDLRAPGQIVTSTSLLDFGTVTVGQTAVAGLDVFDSVDTSILGDDVASILYSFSATSGFSAPTGTFSDALGGGVNGHLFTFNGASAAGVYSGLLTILSSDPDVLGRTVAFRVNVQAVPEPSAFVALGLGALAFLRRRRKA